MMEVANVGKVQVWIRLADYKAWCEEHNLSYDAFCGQCPCYFICHDSEDYTEANAANGEICAWIQQSCPHLIIHMDYRDVSYIECDFVPLQFISLTEYDNSEFAPE